MDIPDQIIELIKNYPFDFKVIKSLFLSLPRDYDLNYAYFELKNNNIEIIKNFIFIHIKNNTINNILFLKYYGFEKELKQEILKNIKYLNYENYFILCRLGLLKYNEFYPKLSFYQKIIFYSSHIKFIFICSILIFIFILFLF